MSGTMMVSADDVAEVQALGQQQVEQRVVTSELTAIMMLEATLCMAVGLDFIYYHGKHMSLIA